MKNKDDRTFGVSDERSNSSLFAQFDKVMIELYEEGKTEDVVFQKLENIALANIDNKDEQGNDGLYYQMGMTPTNKDTSYNYSSGKGRGLYGNLGSYDNLISGDNTFDKGINNIVTSLSTGRFEIDINEYTDEDEIKQARAEQELLYACLFDPSGGWDMFLREWSESLKYGFSIWEVIFEKNSPVVKKYAFRRANTVYQWILDDEERELLGIKFTGLTGKFTEIPAEDLMIYSHERTGTDFEGKSIARKCAGYLLIKKYLMKIHAAAIEFNGTGIKVYKGEKDSAENARVIALLARSTAEKNGSISIPREDTIEYLSGNGNIPDVESMIRYYDEQIAKAFDNEGSLLGLNQVGSYALATESSKKAAAASQFYGKLVCSMFNGKESFNNIIRKIVDAAFPERTMKNYPKMVFKVSDTSELDQDRINAYITSGLSITTDDINMIRKSMGMEPIVIDDSTKIVSGIGADNPILLAEQPSILPTLAEEQSIDKKEVIPSEAPIVGSAGKEFVPAPPKTESSFSNGFKLSEKHHNEGCGCSLSHNMDLALNDEQEALRAYWEASEKNIGQVLYKMAGGVRSSWVKQLKDVSSYPEIEKMSIDIFDKELGRYKEEIKPLIREAVLKGGASMLKEQGAIKDLPEITSVGKLGKTLSEEWVDYEAGRIATHNLNILLGTLEEQAVRDVASGVITKNPTIPTEESMVKTVGQYAGRSFNYGRNEAMMEVKAIAEKQGLDKPMIAEYSSVLERSTCEPCRQADGTRVIVGSPEYLKMSPPNLCLGRDRCRCIFSVIMPEEKGYDSILKELADGFSKADSTLLSNEGNNTLIEDIMDTILLAEQ